MKSVIRRWILVLGALASVTAPSWGQTEIGHDRPKRDQAHERITALRREIAHHDELYFQRATPEISDFAYDQLRRELSQLEHAFPDAAAATPALPPLGDDRRGDWPTHDHVAAMPGLAKTYDLAELRAFARQNARELGREDLIYVIEPKVDGMAISITYEHGRLIRAVTRGNGTEGDDITTNALMIRSLPHELEPIAADGSANPIPELIELRGEIHLTFAEFERLNRERIAAGEPTFAHPRNLAAGTAKSLDAETVAARNLDIVFFGSGACQPGEIMPNTYHEFRELMARWGLPVVTPVATAHGADEMREAVQALDDTRDQLPYPTDGAVVKLDSLAGQRALGVTDGAPRWAIAFKFTPARAKTRLLAITIQVGRTGLLTPVAELEPVELAGSEITRASLHNRAVIARLDLRIGDQVVVEKAGEIIPQIVGVNLSQRAANTPSYAFPTTCPACGAEVEQAEDVVAVFCPNAACPGQLRRRIEHFASSACVGIDGLGPRLIDTLVDEGWVRSIADLYSLRRDDLLSLGDDITRSVDGLLSEIERSKHTELWRLIHGLGIRGVGAVTSRRLAGAFDTLENLATASAEELSTVESVGAATAANIVSFFAAPENDALVAALEKAGVVPVPSTTIRKAPGPLEGMVFALTGTLPSLTRAEAIDLITTAGGTVRNDVSSNTDYLVAGRNAGNKLEQARALGIEVLDEQSLRQKLGRD